MHEINACCRLGAALPRGSKKSTRACLHIRVHVHVPMLDSRVFRVCNRLGEVGRLGGLGGLGRFRVGR